MIQLLQFILASDYVKVKLLHFFILKERGKKNIIAV